MKKAILWFFPVLLFLFCSCGSQNDHLDKAEIFTLVQENETMLLDCVATENYDSAASLAGIDAINPHPEYVDFQCGGKGISVSATYYGFYYSPTDQPLDYSPLPTVQNWCRMAKVGAVPSPTAPTATTRKKFVTIFITTNHPVDSAIKKYSRMC